ncbi:glycosyltransferase [Microbacterium sp. NPDC076895]|uniref:glycosyltransferase n=1 Tax=Microbacterium sp. NPDC076895 TaxID=3154957 RepID=UPI003427717B
MSMRPLVSIVIPMFNDQEYVATAIQSCLQQTVSDIEVICVDDASTDATCELVESIVELDSRVRLIRQDSNRSAFQARRVGVMAARADHVLFLDGDDELKPEAVEITTRLADAAGADVVGFGVEGVFPAQVSGSFVKQLQPKHRRLDGENIAPALFPEGDIVQGQLWRYLWATGLLQSAYAALAEDLSFPRANDIPISFLALAMAQRYVSTEARLYRYFWRRGASGRDVESLEDFEFYLGALDSIAAIGDAVGDLAKIRQDPATILRPYQTARLSIIQSILRYCAPMQATELQESCYASLHAKARPSEIVLAAAWFYRGALPFLAQHSERVHGLDSSVKRVMIVTGNLKSGGAQGVVISQARHLVDAGFNVVIAARTLRDAIHTPPSGVELVEISGGAMPEKLDTYLKLCREHQVDAIIDHWVLYNDDFPFFALAARTLGIPTIGWIHNFALRPVFDFNTRIQHLSRYLGTLARVVVLSHTDVAFWKLQGISDVVYLPNPPSPLLASLPHRTVPREAPVGPIRLFWWGRLQQHTKRVRSLVDVAAALRKSGVEFSLTVIGPDSPDLHADQLFKYAEELGVSDALTLTGPLQGSELLDALNSADVYVSTSAIEGYPLALTEAQVLGLPVVMFELPWLAVAEANRGILTAPQGDHLALATQIAHLSNDRDAYALHSAASLAAGHDAISHDFDALYRQLLTSELPSEHSPEATLEDAQMLLRLAIYFSEQNVGREARSKSKISQERDAERKEVRRLSRELAKRTEPQTVQLLRPAGRALLRLVPRLRPLAHKFNNIVRSTR